MQNELGVSICDTNDSDQCESDLEQEEDELDIDESNVDPNYYHNTYMECDQATQLLNDRIRKTGEIRQAATENESVNQINFYKLYLRRKN